jgi:hypothetical protein
MTFGQLDRILNYLMGEVELAQKRLKEERILNDEHELLKRSLEETLRLVVDLERVHGTEQRLFEVRPCKLE